MCAGKKWDSERLRKLPKGILAGSDGSETESTILNVSEAKKNVCVWVRERMREWEKEKERGREKEWWSKCGKIYKVHLPKGNAHELSVLFLKLFCKMTIISKYNQYTSIVNFVGAEHSLALPEILRIYQELSLIHDPERSKSLISKLMLSLLNKSLLIIKLNE